MKPSDSPEAAAGRRSAALVSLLVLAILAWTAHAAFVLGDAGAYDEHGFLENSQAALLLLSALVVLHAAATGHGADRPVLLLYAWTCIGMALREIDLDQIEAVPLWLARLTSGCGRTLLLVSGYVALGSFSAVQWRRQGNTIFALLQRRLMLMLALAALLLVVGRYFETQSWLAHHEFLEETAELLAFGLILQLALQLWLRTRQRGPRWASGGFDMAGIGGHRH
jgi:hypothetical protein